MRSSVVFAAVAASVLESVSAHGYVTGITDKGTFTAGTNPNWYYQPAGQAPVTAGWRAMNQDNGFVAPDAFGSSDINCHKSATAGGAYATVAAGDSVTLTWNTWPDTHKGPVLNYLAACSGECTSAKPTDLKWTKISEGAYISGSNPGTWVTDTLIKNNFQSSVTIPKNLKPGNYVIRHEIIALHTAGSANGAQAYPQCLNLKVTGSASVSLPSGTPGTSLYKSTDPGILFNLYTSFSSYTIPGPAVWTGAN